MAEKKARYAILANSSYGLYAGIVDKITAQPDGKMTVEVSECRHVARWYGKTGGITSLAAHGICGASASQSRIGAPVKATLSNIINVFDCTPEARASIVTGYGAGAGAGYGYGDGAGKPTDITIHGS